jgi:hypothetical protein
MGLAQFFWWVLPKLLQDDFDGFSQLTIPTNQIFQGQLIDLDIGGDFLILSSYK